VPLYLTCATLHSFCLSNLETAFYYPIMLPRPPSPAVVSVAGHPTAATWLSVFVAHCHSLSPARVFSSPHVLPYASWPLFWSYGPPAACFCSSSETVSTYYVFYALENDAHWLNYAPLLLFDHAVPVVGGSLRRVETLGWCRGCRGPCRLTHLASSRLGEAKFNP
jgi:hypothetical protein